MRNLPPQFEEQSSEFADPAPNIVDARALTDESRDWSVGSAVTVIVTTGLVVVATFFVLGAIHINGAQATTPRDDFTSIVWRSGVAGLVGCLAVAVLQLISQRRRDAGAAIRLRALAEQNAALAVETRRVLDALVSFAGLLTPEGVLLEANQSALRAGGIHPADVIGKPLWETYWCSFSEDAKAIVRAAVARASKGESQRFDMLVRMANDRMMLIDFVLQPLYDESGAITKLVASGLDLTERQTTQSALRDKDQMLARITDSLPGIVCTLRLDTDGRFVAEYVSSGSLRLIGLDPSLWLSDMSQFYRRLSGDQRAEFDRLIKKSAGELSVLLTDLKVLDSQGAGRWLRVRGAPTGAAGGSII